MGYDLCNEFWRDMRHVNERVRGQAAGMMIGTSQPNDGGKSKAVLPKLEANSHKWFSSLPMFLTPNITRGATGTLVIGTCSLSL